MNERKEEWRIGFRQRLGGYERPVSGPVFSAVKGRLAAVRKARRRRACGIIAVSMAASLALFFVSDLIKSSIGEAAVETKKTVLADTGAGAAPEEVGRAGGRPEENAGKPLREAGTAERLTAEVWPPESEKAVPTAAVPTAGRTPRRTAGRSAQTAEGAVPSVIPSVRSGNDRAVSRFTVAAATLPAQEAGGTVRRTASVLPPKTAGVALAGRRKGGFQIEADGEDAALAQRRKGSSQIEATGENAGLAEKRKVSSRTETVGENAALAQRRKGGSRTEAAVEEDGEDLEKWRTARRPGISAGIYAGHLGSSMGSSQDNMLLEAAPVMDKAFATGPPVIRPMNATPHPIDEKHCHPVKYGMTVSFGPNENVRFGTGLCLSVLKSKFSYTYDSAHEYETVQRLYYAGLPLQVSYRFLHFNRLYLYAMAGGMAEVLVCGRKRMTSADAEPTVEALSGHPFQFSLNTGLGLGLRCTKRLSLYAEPELTYYFKGKSRIESFYTAGNYAFNLNVGLRIDL